MNFIKNEIEDVVIVEPRVFKDPRGYFYESFSESEFVDNGINCKFVQGNQSKSSYGVIRGLHWRITVSFSFLMAVCMASLFYQKLQYLHIRLTDSTTRNLSGGCVLMHLSLVLTGRFL